MTDFSPEQLLSLIKTHEIKGFLAENEALALYSYALSVQGPCLEVGSY